MAKVPRLADVRCSPIRFRPGDRVLVRSHHRLDRDSHNRLKRAIERWAGPDVEVLIYCPLDMEVSVEHR